MLVVLPTSSDYDAHAYTHDSFEIFYSFEKAFVRSKDPLALTPTRQCYIGSLYAVHVSDYFPEGGVIKGCSPQGNHARQTVHFSLHHAVPQHQDKKKFTPNSYVILIPMASIRDRIIGGYIEDFYALGDVVLPQGSVILYREGLILKSLPGVRLVSYQKDFRTACADYFVNTLQTQALQLLSIDKSVPCETLKQDQLLQNDIQKLLKKGGVGYKPSPSGIGLFVSDIAKSLVSQHVGVPIFFGCVGTQWVTSKSLATYCTYPSFIPYELSPLGQIELLGQLQHQRNARPVEAFWDIFGRIDEIAVKRVWESNSPQVLLQGYFEDLSRFFSVDCHSEVFEVYRRTVSKIFGLPSVQPMPIPSPIPVLSDATLDASAAHFSTQSHGTNL